MEIKMRTVIGVLVGFAAVLGLMTSPAYAVTYDANLSTVDISGGVVAAAMQNELVGGGSPHGTLTTTVYTNATHNLYTYVAQFKPVVNEISYLYTSFVPAGLSGSVGWSFADATNAGASNAAAAFTSFLTATGLEWDRSLSQDFWNNGEQMRIFFQSTFAPGTATFGVYNQSNATIGSAVGYAPNANAVPEPMTLVLLSSGLAGAGLWARWGRKGA